MSVRITDETMNLKLNNDIKGSITTEKSSESLVKDEQNAKRSQREEERRRTGRYMAILVGISLFILALYHAWVRRIPIVASLVVPALIMFVYVAWILYTASREKRRRGEAAQGKGISLFILALYHAWVRRIPIVASLVVPALIMFVYVAWILYTASREKRRRFRLFDLETGQGEFEDADGEVAITELTQNNVEISVVSGKEPTTSGHEDSVKDWTEISTALMKGDKNTRTEVEHNRLPIILVNDKPPEDLDQKWLNIVELTNNDKLKVFHTRRKYKRKFCRSRRHAAFKRSYSIG
ncbi:hypothetical protein PYW07_003763 [Mythimna separata]|uniref:Uncharacterized protein n=1 Tax=Mythimna separata TaxID=271217 RepID=A0AAD7YP46_MYTSE|nr:hypothetical protein PYW07_003763 [Mythimna separata]